MCQHYWWEMRCIHRSSGPYRIIVRIKSLSICNGSVGRCIYSFCMLPLSKGSAATTVVHKRNLHSQRMYLMRFDARMDIIWNICALPESLRKQMRLKRKFRRNVAACSTEKFLQQLYYRNKLTLSRRYVGHLENVCHLDSFLSSVSTPEHLLSGLNKDVL